MCSQRTRRQLRFRSTTSQVNLHPSDRTSFHIRSVSPNPPSPIQPGNTNLLSQGDAPTDGEPHRCWVPPYLQSVAQCLSVVVGSTIVLPPCASAPRVLLLLESSFSSHYDVGSTGPGLLSPLSSISNQNYNRREDTHNAAAHQEPCMQRPTSSSKEYSITSVRVRALAVRDQVKTAGAYVVDRQERPGITPTHEPVACEQRASGSGRNRGIASHGWIA